MTLATTNQSLELPDNELLRTSMKAIKEFQMIVKQNMVEGHDFGTIPGTNKPTLLKPGAEKITKILGLADTYDFIDRQEDWNKPFFRYLVQCNLTAIHLGIVITQGTGECNSYESKYRYRWVYEKDIPQGVDKASLVSKQFTARTGGKFFKYRLDNEDIFSQVNTLVKMACKRALVAAALSAGRLSEIFTQDMEDRIDAEPAPAKTTAKKAQPTPETAISSPAQDGVTTDQLAKLKELKDSGSNLTELIKGFNFGVSKISDLTKAQAQTIINAEIELPF